MAVLAEQICAPFAFVGDVGTLTHFAVAQGNIVFSNELHRMYADQGVVSISLHPGNLKTDLQRHVSTFEKCVTVRPRSHLTLARENFAESLSEPAAVPRTHGRAHAALRRHDAPGARIRRKGAFAWMYAA